MKELFNKLCNVFNFFNEKRFIYQFGGDTPKATPESEKPKDADKTTPENPDDPVIKVKEIGRGLYKTNEIKVTGQLPDKPDYEFEPEVITLSNNDEAVKESDYEFEPEVITLSKNTPKEGNVEFGAPKITKAGEEITKAGEELKDAGDKMREAEGQKDVAIEAINGLKNSLTAALIRTGDRRQSDRLANSLAQNAKDIYRSGGQDALNKFSLEIASAIREWKDSNPRPTLSDVPALTSKLTSIVEKYPKKLI